jgi:hypothetical protein
MRENNVMTKTALNALTLPEGERRNYLQQQRDVAANDGRSTDRIDGALAGDDASLNQALNFQAREGQTVESLYKAQFPEAPAEQTPLELLKAKKLQAEINQISQAPKGSSVSTEGLDTLVSGVSKEAQDKAKASYNLAGGGKDGLKALTESLKTSVETERRAAAPETLKANFPNANEAELKELQAVVDSSKTTESGFKEAGKLREKQRQVKIGNDTKARGLEIITKLFDNDELDDVIGSIEGSDKSIIPFVDKKSRSDKEAEAIADIEELESILTAGSLKLMSGVLSESDIGILKNIAAGGLNRMRGEKRFREDLARIQEKLKGALGVKDKDLTKTTDEDLLSF